MLSTYDQPTEDLVVPVSSGATKLCSKCEIRKPVLEFPPRRGRSGCAHQPGTCIDCYKLGRKQYYQRNKDRFRQRALELRAINRVKYRNSQRQYVRSRPQECKAYRKKYADSHKDLYREARQRHNALKRNASTDRVSYVAIVARDNGHCYLCGWIVLDHERTIDHIMPLARGGSHTESNLAVAHRVCNSKKSKRLLSEIYRDGHL